MMRMKAWRCALLAATLACGCTAKGDEAKLGETRAETKGDAPPAAEGMCKEHGVLEAICTKCNPKLAAVFQAKGDWCPEHGLPESVCPICHPERGGKPTADVATDGAPADGVKIRFKRKDTAALAGIETAKATVRPGGGGLITTARLSYDATKLAQINARSPGVVRALKADVGTKVKKGDPLVVIDSAEVGADRARLQAARSRVDVTEQNYKREQALVEEGITSQKSLLAARQELDEAKSEYGAIAASLSVLGAAGGGVGGYTLSSPIAGVVTERNATIGKMVSPDQVLYEIVDTSSMWAELDIPEGELSLVAPDHAVTLTFDAVPGRELTGKIGYVAPAVDPHTRTAKARVALLNPDGALRAHMYGQARIVVEAERQAVMVPRAAVQRAKGVHLAFVRLKEDEYETRRIEIGISEGDFVEVRKGLRPGEDVATQGSFLLKTETLKESIGAGCCEGE
jgi:cobalt-zinc-cadmium efflux system membrane fusion protein